MTTVHTLTAATRRTITEDWGRAFPNLLPSRPLWLMKLHGPLVVGVCLDRTRSNDRYIPVFHVHNLLRRFPVISLTLYTAVPDQKQPRMRREILVRDHEKEFGAAAGWLKQHVEELSTTDMTLSTVVGRYAAYVASRQNPAFSRYPLAMFTDVALLLYWCGRRHEAHQFISRCEELMRTWPDSEVELSVWRRTILTAVEGGLDRVAATEVERHKLGKVPRYPLRCDLTSGISLIDAYLTSNQQ